jgi:hypothetical protein
MRKLAILFIVFICLQSVNAQPPHSCGGNFALTVVYPKIDAGGYAPRAAAGYEAVFDCLSARDPNFASQRFANVTDALNYFLTVLYAPEFGVSPGLMHVGS